MELAREKRDFPKYNTLTIEQEELRFELFDWIKGKGFSALQAIDLMALTTSAIRRACLEEASKPMA
ncbi:hypothetical protein LQZ18_15550 [Lachnospiraceae bacterium ZAX-1]